MSYAFSIPPDRSSRNRTYTTGRENSSGQLSHQKMESQLLMLLLLYWGNLHLMTKWKRHIFYNCCQRKTIILVYEMTAKTIPFPIYRHVFINIPIQRWEYQTDPTSELSWCAVTSLSYQAQIYQDRKALFFSKTHLCKNHNWIIIKGQGLLRLIKLM